MAVSVSTVANIAPQVGTDTTTGYQLQSVGSFVLCYMSAGGVGVAVEQKGIRLTVTSTTIPPAISPHLLSSALSLYPRPQPPGNGQFD